MVSVVVAPFVLKAELGYRFVQSHLQVVVSRVGVRYAGDGCERGEPFFYGFIGQLHVGVPYGMENRACVVIDEVRE